MSAGPDAPSEGDSERDGAFSYAAEWHAFAIGVKHGLVYRPLNPRPEKRPDNPDVKKEPHYFDGGFAIGTLLQYLLIGISIWLGRGVM